MKFNELKPYELYKHFEHLNGHVEDSWLIAAKKIIVPQIKEIIKELHFFANFNNSNKTISERFFSATELNALKTFIDYANSKEFVSNLVHSAQEHSSLYLDSPICNEKISCNTSVCAGSVIFLRFIDAKEPIYLIQENFAAEALFFPMRNCVVSLGGFLDPEGKLEKFFLEFFKNAEKYLKYFCSNERKWGGIYFGHQSPFHFFYFQLPGIVYAFSSNSVRLESPAFYSFNHQYYLNVPDLLDIDTSLRIHENREPLREDILENKKFIFSLGLRPLSWRNKLFTRMMDSMVIDYCLKEAQMTLPKNLIDSDLVVWMGVTTGKRAWLEEVDTLIEFLNILSDRYSKVSLILDGWTSTMVGINSPELYSGDESKLDAIMAAAPYNVSCYKILGENPCRKIAFANAADFFIANHGTGSMFVSRFAKRIGITHISNSARAASVNEHIHWKSRLVPAEIVMDKINGDEKTAFHISYSINKSDFLNLALSTFETLH